MHPGEFFDHVWIKSEINVKWPANPWKPPNIHASLSTNIDTSINNANVNANLDASTDASISVNANAPMIATAVSTSSPTLTTAPAQASTPEPASTPSTANTNSQRQRQCQPTTAPISSPTMTAIPPPPPTTTTTPSIPDPQRSPNPLPEHIPPLPSPFSVSPSRVPGLAYSSIQVVLMSMPAPAWTSMPA